MLVRESHESSRTFVDIREICGRVLTPEAALGAWFAATPWASYVLRYPAEKSLVTFDRVAVLLISAAFVARAWRRRGRVPSATLFEAAWLCFTVVAALNALAIASDKGPALRTVVDAYFLPLALFYALRNGWDASRGRVALFWGAVVLALSLPWAGIYEFVTATDFMPYKGSSIFRTGIVRANGPFSTDNSYSIISALVA